MSLNVAQNILSRAAPVHKHTKSDNAKNPRMHEFRQLLQINRQKYRRDEVNAFHHIDAGRQQHVILLNFLCYQHGEIAQ